MSRIVGKPSVLVEGSDALRELIETYATMDIKAFCAKWDLAISTVRSTASRRGLRRLRGKEAKIGTANTDRGIKHPSSPKPEPETLLVPAYEPPKDMIPPSLLKQLRGRYSRVWRTPSSRAELNTMPVPYPFSEIADAPYNRGWIKRQKKQVVFCNTLKTDNDGLQRTHMSLDSG
jgi:hypothetical protein